MRSNAASSTLRVRAHPGAKQDSLERDGETWRVRVAAPPVDGRANEQLCRFVARDVLGVPARAVRVKSGAGGRDKVLEIDLDGDAVEQALAAWVAAHA